MDRKPLYAQFDGDEVDDTVYRLGDPLDEKVDSGTVQYLVTTGRFSASRPAKTIVIPAGGFDKDIGSMTRAELETEALSATAAHISKVSDDELRSVIERHRETQGEDAVGQDDVEDDVYADIKDLPLDKLKTDQLNAVAQAEGVTFDESVKTNAQRAAAIQAKRDEAANAPEQSGGA